MGFSRQEYWSGFLLQEIFPTQGLNPDLLHCRQMLYPEVEPAVPRANKKRVQDGVVCVAYVPGRVACAVLSMTGAGVHFN